MAIVLPPAPPRSMAFTAVEFDVLDDHGTLITLLLSGGGAATVMRNGLPYYPRLTNFPILLGSTITVTQYGNPVRAQPNAGVIQFRIDSGIWIWLTAYRWLGRPFRVYEGSRPSPFATTIDVDADMVLVYAGRITGLSHDCFTATVQTTDASLDLDNPLVTNFYDVTFPTGIQGKPRPTARGKFFSGEGVIVDETQQLYEVQSLPQGLTSVDEVRVGGVPWTRVVAPPKPGQWSPIMIAGVIQRIQLGSPPSGQDVRVDGTAGLYLVGDLITAVVTSKGGKVDAAAMAALNVQTAFQSASLVTGLTPINTLNALDDPVTAGGCWWGFNPLEQATAAAIKAPDLVGKYKLTEVQINTISLNTIQPLAWRIRVGTQRNWQPESSFDDGVLQSDVAKWNAPALVLEPHYENPAAITLEPRAVDVPLLSGTSHVPNDAINEQTRLIAAWGVDRTVLDVTVWMRPEDIVLYDTVEVEFMMMAGTFRIVSAIRAIGGNGPATLQLWGTMGALPPPPPLPLPLPPPFVPPPGGVVPPGASGPGVAPGGAPGGVTPLILSVALSPAANSIPANATAGTVIAAISVFVSDASPFSGILSVSAGYLMISTVVPPLNTPPGTALFSIHQPTGPAYVGVLSPRNLAWWQADPGVTVAPFTGALPVPRPGASLYQITQPYPGAPSYIGDLTPADLSWWLATGSRVVPYVTATGLPPGVAGYLVLGRDLSSIDTSAGSSVTAVQAGTVSATATENVTVSPGTALYSIVQLGGGPSYVGTLTPQNVAWWQNTGSTVTPYAGVLPTPRPGASLYQIVQPGAATDPTVPGYIGDLTPADVAFWQGTGSTVTPYNPTGAVAPPAV